MSDKPKQERQPNFEFNPKPKTVKIAARIPEDLDECIESIAREREISYSQALMRVIRCGGQIRETKQHGCQECGSLAGHQKWCSKK